MGWELNSDRPIYTQVYEKILTRIVCGIYQPGNRVPSVRELAAEANVNPNTMQRAFSELEHSGLIVTQRNSGRVVTQDQQMIDSAKREIALTQIRNLLARLQELGYTNQEIMELINSLIES